MKKQLLLLLILVSCFFSGLAQQNVGINTTNPDPSAALHIEATDKGVLIPRLTTTQREMISNAATGLLVFDTDTGSFWFYNGTAWADLSAPNGSEWEKNGNDLFYNGGNIGIGTSTPHKPLDIASVGGLRISRTDSISSNNELFFADFGQIRSSDDNHRIIFDRNSDIFEIREYGDIHFSTGSTGQRTSKMVVNSQGDVGIGADIPQEKLEVAGNVKANAFLGNGSQLTGININDPDSDPDNELQTLSQTGNDVTLSNGGGSISVADSDDDATNELQNWSNLPGIPINIDTDSTNDFSGSFLDLTDVPVGLDDGDPWEKNGNDIFYSSGNIGVGTPTPNKPLDIAGPGGIRISRTDSISSNNELFFADFGQIRSSDDNHRIIFDRNSDIFEIREYGQIHFSPGSFLGQRTSKMVVTSEGRVGIGTTSPGAALEVSGDVFAGDMSVGNISANDVSAGDVSADSIGANKFSRIFINRTDSISDANEIIFQDNGQIRSFNDDHRIIFDRENDIFEIREFGDIHFSTGSTGQRTSKMVVTSEGRVGIGINTPQEELEVAGIVKANVFLGDGSQLTGIDVNDADADPENELELPVNPQAGDLAYYESGAWQRLPPGTDGQVMTMSGGTPDWATPSSSEGDVSNLLQVTLPDGATLYVYPTDNSAEILWGEYLHDIYVIPNMNTVGEANTDFNGEFNTQAIAGHLGNYNNTVYAAKLCAEWQAFGFDDWYLPAAGELNAMYQQLGPTNNGYGGSGDITTSFYWSSSEVDDYYAWVQYFVSGLQFGGSKANFVRCRCVRR